MSSVFGKNSHILIADQDMQQHSSLVAVLQTIPYTVTMMENESQIFNHALLINPDLIVLDLRMPELLGIEVAIMLKESQSTRHIPIIFLSSLHQASARLKGLRAGAVDYIVKPYHVEEVQERIKIHLTLSQKCAGCIHCAKALQPISELLPPNQNIRQLATQFILSHIGDSTLTGSQVAKTLDLPYHRLNLVFEAIDGITVFEFIRRERMTRAAGMLKQTSLSVAEIALAFGYPTSSSFSTEFKKYWKKPPLQYRMASQRGMP